MAIIAYAYAPILVDISDAVIGTTVVKRRARRVDVRLPDDPSSPCVLEVEVIPYAQLAGGTYGAELTGSVFRRSTCFIRVSHHRLVDEASGRWWPRATPATGRCAPMPTGRPTWTG
jgi:hypothetical protein